MDIIEEDIKLYLPQYLSSSEKDALIKELRKFPTNGTKDTIYTSALDKTKYLLQGDGIDQVPYASFPDTTQKRTSVILLSNTCDMSIDNLGSRLNNCRILYSPLIKFEKYEAILRSKYSGDKDQKRIDNHLKDIKSQHITQALFLPKGGNLEYDSIIFFDRAISIPLKEELTSEMSKNRIFTLSNFGFYLFLLKISIHFTRIQEKIDRNIGVDLGLDPA